MTTQALLLAAKAEQRPLLVGAFSAASNVTGLLTDVDAVTLLLHRHDALALWDYASAAPYLPVQVRRLARVGVTRLCRLLCLRLRLHLSLSLSLSFSLSRASALPLALTLTPRLQLPVQMNPPAADAARAALLAKDALFFPNPNPNPRP